MAYEEEYKYFSELAIQEKVKLNNIDYQVNTLINSKNVKTNSMSTIDSEISKISAKIASLKDSGQSQ